MANSKQTKGALLQEVARLRAERDELLGLLHMAPVAIGVTRGPDHVLTFANAALEAEFGDRELLGKPFRDAFPAMADMGIHESLDAVFGSGRVLDASEVPMPGRSAGGVRRERHFDVRHVPVAGPDGDVEAVASYAVDATERVNRGRQLDYALGEMRLTTEELNRCAREGTAPVGRAQESDMARELKARTTELEQAVAHANHVVERMTEQMRTPLHVLMGFGSILRKELHGPLNARQHDELAKVLGAGQIMSQLLEEGRAFSRAHREEPGVSPEAIDFTASLASALAELRPDAVNQGQRAAAVTPIDGPILHADQGRLHQVLTGLIADAIRSAPGGGTIRVRAREVGDQLHCEIEDTGEGLAPPSLPALFTPFASMAPGVLDPASELGLGLTVSKAIVEAHGGSLQVESHQERCSVFRIAMPVVGQGGSPTTGTAAR